MIINNILANEQNHKPCAEMVQLLKDNAERFALDYLALPCVKFDNQNARNQSVLNLIPIRNTLAYTDFTKALEVLHYTFLNNTNVSLAYSETDTYGGNYDNLQADINNNKRLTVYTGNNDASVLGFHLNLTFRGVHDYFGHYSTNSPFSLNGEIESVLNMYYHLRQIRINWLRIGFDNLQLWQKQALDECTRDFDINFIAVLLCEVVAQSYVHAKYDYFVTQKMVVSEKMFDVAEKIYERFNDIHNVGD